MSIIKVYFDNIKFLTSEIYRESSGDSKYYENDCRSDNVYFANNEQASVAFTAAFCLANAKHNN